MTQHGFALNIVSPEESVFAGSAGYVSIPGEDGVLGILPKHTPVITSLATGRLDVYNTFGESAPAQSFVISGGFAEISGASCTVLADLAVDIADIDAQAMQNRIDELQAKRKHEEGELQRKNIDTEIDFCKTAIRCRNAA